MAWCLITEEILLAKFARETAEDVAEKCGHYLKLNLVRKSLKYVITNFGFWLSTKNVSLKIYNGRLSSEDKAK